MKELKEWISEYAVVWLVAVILPGDITTWYWWALMVLFVLLLFLHDYQIKNP